MDVGKTEALLLYLIIIFSYSLSLYLLNSDLAFGGLLRFWGLFVVLYLNVNYIILFPVHSLL